MADVIDLTLTQTSIEAQIIATLKEIASVYSMGSADSLKLDGAFAESFADGWESQGLVNTAEALECFFIPYFKVKGVREAFWDGELIPIEAVRSAVEYLAVKSKNDPDNNGLRSLSGKPYIDFRTVGRSETASGIERNMDFMDTACFLLPCLLDAKAINSERDALLKQGLLRSSPLSIIDDGLLEAVDDRIAAAASLLRACDLGPGSGWTYTDDPLETNRLDHLYFTWNALEALEILVRYFENASHLVPKAAADVWGGSAALDTLRSLLRAKQSYLSATFLSLDNKNLNICESRIDFGDEDSNWYYNLFAAISLLITGYSDKARLVKAFGFLFENLKGMTLEKAGKKEHGVFLLGGSLYNKHKKDWSERALTPLFTKAIARLHQLDEELLNDVIQPLEIFESSEQLLSTYLGQLADERIILPDSGFGNLWANLGGEAIYSIYYTERAIEALTSLYSCLVPSHQITPHYTSIPIEQRNAVGTAGGSAPQIQIIIAPEVIRDSILEEIQQAARQKIQEIMDSEEITDLIKNKLAKEDDASFKARLDDLLDYLIVNSDSAKPDRGYKRSLDTLTTLIGKQLSEAVFTMLHTADPDAAKKIDKKDFISRFMQGLRYIVEWETRSQGAVDYGKTLSELHAKKLVQFTGATSGSISNAKE